MKGLHIIATGHYAPERIVTNDDLSKMVDTTDEWITTRTGMKKRHFCGEKDSNVTLAVAAATRAIAQTDIEWWLPHSQGIIWCHLRHVSCRKNLNCQMT